MRFQFRSTGAGATQVVSEGQLSAYNELDIMVLL
jgi:hypothetical protein